MADKKLYLCVTPPLDTSFDEWCYPIFKENGWKAILDDIETSLESAFMDNDEELDGIKLKLEIKMMDSDEIMDVSDK